MNTREYQMSTPMRLETLDEPSSSPKRCKMRFDVIRPYLDEDSVGAEIGVFKGAFLAYLLSTRPKKLYAVDPWYRLSSEWPWAQGDKSTVEALLRILKEYRHEIETRLIEPRIEYSYEFLQSIPDGTLDWVYIDSSHLYEGTIQELTLAEKKVKSEGLILGDDYNSDPDSRHHGVFKAVREFSDEGRLTMLVEGDGMQFVAKLPKRI